MKAFFITLPHSGEDIPSECDWLMKLDPIIQKQDLDLYVDQLYSPVIEELNIPSVVAKVSRYVVDLNRNVSDIESLSVENSDNDIGKFHKKGLHWVETTRGEAILNSPHSEEFHSKLVERYYTPWHEEVASTYSGFDDSKEKFQLDCHSMPSQGTAAHSDPGKQRPEVVISDYLGKSSCSEYLDLVVKAFKGKFADVAVNDPYIGGGITARYGNPSIKQHCLQIELRRNLYMNEDTKAIIPESFSLLQEKLSCVLREIYDSDLIK